MNSHSFDVGTLTVHQIVPVPPSQGGVGTVDIAPKFMSGHSTRPTVVIHTSSVVLPAAEFVNTKIINTDAGAPITLTMPTAAAGLAAFLAKGITLNAGDTFTLEVCTNANQSIVFAPSASVTTMSGAANFTVTGLKSAMVTFRVNSVTVGAEAMSFSGLLGN